MFQLYKNTQTDFVNHIFLGLFQFKTRSHFLEQPVYVPKFSKLFLTNFCQCLKVNCKGFTSFVSYERAFRMLKNDMCIIEIGQAVFEL